MTTMNSMINWENKIIETLISHYFTSANATAIAEVFADGNRRTLRIRSSVLFPDFDAAHPDEKESYLEAVETLERKKLIKLNWEKNGKGERLKTLSCENIENLFKEAKRSFPNTEAKTIRDMLKTKSEALRESSALSSSGSAEAKRIIDFLEFYSIHFYPRYVGQGIDGKIMEEFIRLLDFCSSPARYEKLSTRALSVLLYRDSKRLENILTLCKPLLSGAEKFFSGPNLSYLERSYPETMISVKIVIEYKKETTPLINAGGHILGISLENAEEIKSIQLVTEKKEKAVLSIENKETFYALGSQQKHGVSENLSCYDCFLYTGGYPNRAAAALIKVMAASDFSFCHAGDLDPDGILILQNIQDLAERPVIPLRMDAATFDQYQAWAKTLSKPAIRQIKKIREKTKAIPDLADLLRRIEETGLGLEQEIVDYR